MEESDLEKFKPQEEIFGSTFKAVIIIPHNETNASDVSDGNKLTESRKTALVTEEF